MSRSREYLLSDDFKREFEGWIDRRRAALEEEKQRRERRRRRLNRLTLGLLGR